MAITILLADGVTPNDADHPFVATSIDGTLDGFIVASADHYSADATFTMPTEWQVSFASPWTTWYGAAEAPAACPEFSDVAYPVRFRQHSYGTTDSNTFSTAGTDTACTALTAISDLAAGTPGDASVPLTWSAVANATYIKIQRATDSGFTANLVTLTSTLAGNSTSYTNNAANGNAPVNGTTYYYRAYELGTGRYSDSTASNVVSGTPNITWDLLSEPFDSLTGWTRTPSTGGTLEINPAGQMHLLPITTGDKFLLANRDFGTLPAQYTCEILVKWDSLGASPNGRADFHWYDGIHVVYFAMWSDKVGIYNDSSTFTTITHATSTGTWYTYRVTVDSTNHSVKIYEKTTGAWSYLGEWTDIKNDATSDGEIALTALYTSAANKAEMHADYWQIATGLFEPTVG